MQYRAEIDGLRTLAVMSVVFFHFNMFHIGGGYLGVDIFFVISGYLMTYIITDELKKGDFSFSRFYLRRARRILPALFAMLAVTLAVVCLAGLAPKYMRQFFGSLQAAIFSGGNIFFYLVSGYWDGAAATKPLLHTWSLGVEEQFYFGLPLLLWGIFALFRKNAARCTSAILGLLIVISLVSFIYVGRKVDQDFAFYMLPTRMWELLLGSCSAVYVIYKGRLNIYTRWKGVALFEIVCLGIMLGCIFGARSSAMFKNWENTALTVAAVAFFLIGPGTGPVSRILSLRPIVWLGKISYSIYLWHWPVWVLYLYYMGSNRQDIPVTMFECGMLVAIVIILAALSWRFVEQPFRRKTVGWKHIAAVFIPATALLVGVTLCADTGKITGLESAHYKMKYQVAYGISPERAAAGKFSTFGKGKGKDFIIVGDSHSQCLFPAFDSVIDETGLSGTLATNASLWLAPEYQSRNYEANRRIAHAIYDHIEKQDIKNVIFVFRVNGKKSGFIQEARYTLFFNPDGTSRKGTDADFYNTLESNIQKLIAQGRHVYFVEQAPHQPYNIMEREWYRGVTSTEASWYDGYNEWLEKFCARFDSKYFTLVKTTDAFRENDSYIFIKDGKLLYSDYHHISLAGALHLVPVVRRVLEDIAVRRQAEK